MATYRLPNGWRLADGPSIVWGGENPLRTEDCRQLKDFLIQTSPDRAVIQLRSNEEYVQLLKAVGAIDDSWSVEKFVKEGIKRHFTSGLQDVNVGDDLWMKFDGKLGDDEFMTPPIPNYSCVEVGSRNNCLE